VPTAVNGGSKLLIFVRSRRVTVAGRCHASFVDRLQDGELAKGANPMEPVGRLQDRHV
jgi:hypothetical protein